MEVETRRLVLCQGGAGRELIGIKELSEEMEMLYVLIGVEISQG